MSAGGFLMLDQEQLITDGWSAVYYKQLDGAKIIRFLGCVESSYCTRGFPAFEIELTDARRVIIEISSDDEGNNGGFIFGLPLVGKE